MPKERRRSSDEVLCRFVLLLTDFVKRSDRPARSPNFTNTAERIGEQLSLSVWSLESLDSGDSIHAIST